AGLGRGSPLGAAGEGQSRSPYPRGGGAGSGRGSPGAQGRSRVGRRVPSHGREGGAGGGGGPLAVLPVGVRALATAPSGGHCPCQSLPLFRPLPPPPPLPRPAQRPHSALGSEESPAPPPRRRRSALRPPFATETFQRPRPLRDSAAARWGRPGGGARLLRGAGPSSAAARPGLGGCRPEGGSERGRARGAATSCAVRREISVRVEEIISDASQSTRPTVKVPVQAAGVSVLPPSFAYDASLECRLLSFSPFFPYT
ncbi:hypothetical protein H8959_000446, partial [Pygathrix nigripes]